MASTSKRTAVSESVTADFTFFVIALGSSSTRIVPWGESTDLLILAVGFWRSLIRAPTGGSVAFGHHERVAEPVVEPDRDVAGELHVLDLVLADGHLVGVVEEDVGGHEDRVVEEPGAHRFLALRPSP